MNNLVPGAAFGLFLMPIAVAAASWQPFSDPSGVISARVPASWHAEKPTDMGFSQIISFRLPEEGAEFTISITPNLRLPDELPSRMVERFFPPGAVLGQPQRTKGKGWNAVRQEAKAELRGQPRAWLGAFYGVGSTMIAVTLSDYSNRIDTHRPVFAEIVESVRVQSVSSPGRADEPIT